MGWVGPEQRAQNPKWASTKSGGPNWNLTRLGFGQRWILAAPRTAAGPELEVRNPRPVAWPFGTSSGAGTPTPPPPGRRATSLWPMSGRPLRSDFGPASPSHIFGVGRQWNLGHGDFSTLQKRGHGLPCLPSVFPPTPTQIIPSANKCHKCPLHGDLEPHRTGSSRTTLASRKVLATGFSEHNI